MNDFTLVNVDEPDRQKMLLKKSQKRIKAVAEMAQDKKALSRPQKNLRAALLEDEKRFKGSASFPRGTRR